MSARFLVQWLLLVLLTAVAFFQVIHFYYADYWKSSRQKAMIMWAKKQTHFPTCNVPSKVTHQVTPIKAPNASKPTLHFQTFWLLWSASGCQASAVYPSSVKNVWLSSSSGDTKYILWLTSPPMHSNYAPQEKKWPFGFFFIFLSYMPKIENILFTCW